MPTKFDLKQEWEKTKEQLIQFSKEAGALARKGEAELVKFSKRGKLHIDATAAGLRKEQLYYWIGKEYVKGKASAKPSAKLKKLLEEFETLAKEQKSLERKLKSSPK